MNKWKKLSTAIAMAIIMAIITPAILPNQFVAVAQAATIKLNKTSLSLEVGKSYTLKVSGTKDKVTWTSSDKKVATVSSKGKVTGKKAGKATITATVNKKKFTCKVTVKKAATTDYLKKAPFEAQEITFAEFKAVVPTAWDSSALQFEGTDMVLLTPKGADPLTGTSNITVLVSEKLEDVELTEENIEETLGLIGDDIKVSNMKMSKVDTALGKATKVTYQVEIIMEGYSGKFGQELYLIDLKDRILTITATDSLDNKSDELKEVADYLIKSLQKVK